MKKLLLLITCLFVFVASNAQTYDVVDTIHPSIIGTDTLFHFHGYTDNIVGWLIDCRSIDDTADVKIYVGTGLAAYDTTFIQFTSPDQPATVSILNDFLVGFEKKGVAFPNARLKFDRAASDSTKTYPIRITYDPD